MSKTSAAAAMAMFMPRTHAPTSPRIAKIELPAMRRAVGASPASAWPTNANATSNEQDAMMKSGNEAAPNPKLGSKKPSTHTRKNAVKDATPIVAAVLRGLTPC